MSRPRRATLTALAIVLALLGAGCSSESPGPADAATPAPGAATAEWTAYGGDALGARFSPLAEVTRDNVTSMVVA